MELDKAQWLSDKILKVLGPVCSVTKVAGSVRRQKSEVGDIEICAIPLTKEITTDLFGTVAPVPIAEFSNAVESLGRIVKGNVNGRYMKIDILTTKGKSLIDLDLFLPYPPDFFRQYAIRTGSDQFTHKRIAAGWNAIGWCGSDHGLRKIKDCKKITVGNKTEWQCINPNATKPPVWKSEIEFFDWIKLPWVEPKFRFA